MAGLGHPGFELILDRLNVAAGETIADLGCSDVPALRALQSRGHGLIWFRWFHPAETPQRPTTTLAQL